MGTQTTAYSFHLPEVGGDGTTWGNDFDPADDPAVDPSPGLNGNWSKMDLLLKSLNDRADALIAASGGSPYYERGSAFGGSYRIIGEHLECWGEVLTIEGTVAADYVREFDEPPTVLLMLMNDDLPPNVTPMVATHFPAGDSTDNTEVRIRVYEQNSLYVVPDLSVMYYAIGKLATT